MDLVSAGQTRRRQGLLSLFLGLGVVPFVVAFLEEEWRISGTEEEYGLCCFFLFNLNQYWFGNGLNC